MTNTANYNFKKPLGSEFFNIVDQNDNWDDNDALLKGFENKIVGIMEDCVSFLKKEFKKITKKTLSLKMVDEPQLRVETINAFRSWVIGVCNYEVAGLEKPEKYPEKWTDKLDKNMKSWLGVDKRASQYQDAV